MNLILLDKEEIAADRTVPLTGRRAEHIIKVLRSKRGDTLRVGIINGAIGTALITEIKDGTVVIVTDSFDKRPPQPWFDLILAVPRPKVLHRLWMPLASLGVRNIVLTNAAKVERCYFDTHWLNEENYLPLLREGLEQASTTAIPMVHIERGFKAFIEDRLDKYFPNSVKYIAHPRLSTCTQPVPNYTQNPADNRTIPVVAIGPEGGWSDYELNVLFSRGFQPLTLGERALRTDTAITMIVGALAGAVTTPAPSEN